MCLPNWDSKVWSIIHLGGKEWDIPDFCQGWKWWMLSRCSGKICLFKQVYFKSFRISIFVLLVVPVFMWNLHIHIYIYVYIYVYIHIQHYILCQSYKKAATDVTIMILPLKKINLANPSIRIIISTGWSDFFHKQSHHVNTMKPWVASGKWVECDRLWFGLHGPWWRSHSCRVTQLVSGKTVCPPEERPGGS